LGFVFPYAACEQRKNGSSVASGNGETGIGYDAQAGIWRPLKVGGIELPFDKGPWDTRTGTCWRMRFAMRWVRRGSGIIGIHFPDTDPKWKGANSMLFLEHAKKFCWMRSSFAIDHVDAVVITEKPKLGPHFPKMPSVGKGAERECRQNSSQAKRRGR